MADTGNTATLTLATTGSVGTVKSLQLPSLSVEELEDSDLGTTNWKTYISSDLAEPGELSIEVFFDGENGVVPTVGSAAELATVTFPVVTTGQTAGTFTATGFIKSIDLPQLANGELQMATIVFKLDGKTTEPTFTAETA